MTVIISALDACIEINAIEIVDSVIMSSKEFLSRHNLTTEMMKECLSIKKTNSTFLQGVKNEILVSYKFNIFIL